MFLTRIVLVALALVVGVHSSGKEGDSDGEHKRDETDNSDADTSHEDHESNEKHEEHGSDGDHEEDDSESGHKGEADSHSDAKKDIHPCGTLLPGLQSLNIGVDAASSDSFWSHKSSVKQPIFELTCENGRVWKSPYTDDTYDLPDQIGGQPQAKLSIETSGSATVIKSEKELSKTFDLGGGFSFAGVETQLLQGLEAQASFNHEAQQSLKSDKYVAMKSRNAFFYTLTLSPPSTLTITDTLLDYLKDLPDTLDEDGAYRKYNDFVKYFGTHYVSSGTLGGMYLYTTEVEKEWADSTSSSEVDGSIDVGFNAWGGNAEGGHSSSETKSESSHMTDTKRKFIGGTSSDHDVDKWEETVPEAPVLLTATLEPLHRLVRGLDIGISSEKLGKIADIMKDGMNHHLRTALWNSEIASLQGSVDKTKEFIDHLERQSGQYSLTQSKCECQYCPKASEDMSQFSMDSGCDQGVTDIDDWVNEHCNGWGEESRCIYLIDTEVQQFGHKFEHINISTLDKKYYIGFAKNMQKRYDELKEYRDSLEDAVEYLSSNTFGEHRMTNSEMSDRVTNAKKIEKSEEKRLTIRIGIPEEDSNDLKLEERQSCNCFSLNQGRYFWDEAPDSEPNPKSASGAMTMGDDNGANFGVFKVQTMEMGEALETEEEFYDAADQTSLTYAKNHQAWASSWLLIFPYGIYSEWLSDSGPLFPPYDLDLGSMKLAPCSNAYHLGYSFPSGLLGIGYFTSAPMGLCTPCPTFAEQFGWVAYGRPLPDMRFCSSHPLASCSQSDGGANNEGLISIEEANDAASEDSRRLRAQPMAGSQTNLEIYGTSGRETTMIGEGIMIFFAPKGHVYDARLVEALHFISEQGATLRVVTLFGTTMSQFKALGINPSDTRKMHMGVTLEFSKPVSLQKGGEATWRSVTLEMMVHGLMWTMSEDAALTKGYDYQRKWRAVYDKLDPRVVARFISARRNERYRIGSTDCQTLAIDIADRCALHGVQRDKTFDDMHTSHLRPWFIVVVSLAVIATGAFVALGFRFWRKYKNMMESARSPIRLPSKTTTVAGLLFLSSSFLAFPLGAYAYYRHRRGARGRRHADADEEGDRVLFAEVNEASENVTAAE